MAFWDKWFADKKPELPVYTLPAGQTVYAVGDVHGRADLLLKLMAKIEADISALPEGQNVSLIFLGDYIDRGFHSREVIEALLTLALPGVEVFCLAGNHEDMLLNFLDDPANGGLWLGVGGLAALASYGVYVAEDSDVDALVQASNELKQKMPASHLEFLQNLKEDHRIGDYYFVHAGLRPDVPFVAQRREDKLGIRREFTKSDFDFGCKIVHGHTGVRKPEIRPNRIAVDTGAFATGVLTTAVLQDDGISFIST